MYISSLRNLSVPSWAIPFLTLGGIRALPYHVFQRERDISEQDNSVGMCVSSKWTEGPRICICLLCVCSPVPLPFPRSALYEVLLQIVWKSGAGCFHLGKNRVYTHQVLSLCDLFRGTEAKCCEAEPRSSTVFRHLICLCSRLRDGFQHKLMSISGQAT